MRIRTTGLNQTRNYTTKIYWCPIGTVAPVIGSGDIQSESWDYFSVFADEGGRVRRTSLQKFPNLMVPKACKREQYWLLKADYLDFQDWYQVRVVAPGKFMVPQSTVRQLYPDYSRDLLAAAGRRAWVSMSKDIDSSVSIANFLLELRDVRSLVEHLPNLVKGFSQVGKKLGKEGGSLTDLLTFLRLEASNAHLQWAFGIKPLISDLQKLQSVTADLYKRFAWLNKTYGKVTTIRYQEELQPPPHPYIPDWTIELGTVSTGRLQRGAYKAVFRAQALLYHKVKPPSGAMEFFNVYARKLGLDNPTKIVWNALPFSFVLDWFLNTSQLLDTLTEDRVLEGEWTLAMPQCSITIESDFNVWFQGRSFYGNPWKICGGGRTRIYQRIVGIPMVPVQAELTGATPGQQLLGLSLINVLSKR